MPTERETDLHSDHAGELLLQVLCVDIVGLVALLLISDDVCVFLDFRPHQVYHADEPDKFGQSHDPQLQRQVGNNEDKLKSGCCDAWPLSQSLTHSLTHSLTQGRRAGGSYGQTHEPFSRDVSLSLI